MDTSRGVACPPNLCGTRCLAFGCLRVGIVLLRSLWAADGARFGDAHARDAASGANGMSCSTG